MRELSSESALASATRPGRRRTWLRRRRWLANQARRTGAVVGLATLPILSLGWIAAARAGSGLAAANRAIACTSFLLLGLSLTAMSLRRLHPSIRPALRWAPHAGAAGVVYCLIHAALSLVLLDLDTRFRAWCLEHPVGFILGVVGLGYLLSLAIWMLPGVAAGARRLLLQSAAPLFALLSAHVVLLTYESWFEPSPNGSPAGPPLGLLASCFAAIVVALQAAALRVHPDHRGARARADRPTRRP